MNHKQIFISIYLISINYIHAQNFELIKSFVGNTEKSEIISFTPNKELLLSGDFAGYLNYWFVPKQELISSKKSHNGKINRINFSENGNLFLTFSSEDNNVKVWNFKSQNVISTFYIEQTPFFSIFYDNNSLLIGDSTGKIFHKNIYQNDKDSVFLEEKIKINDSYLNHQKKELVLISESFLKILNLKNFKKNIFEISNPYSSKFVKCDYYSDNILMTWSENGIVTFWDIQEKKILKELRAKNNFYELSINKYSKILLTGYYKDKAILFDLINLDLELELDDNIQLVNTYLTNEMKEYMVSSSQEGRHRLMQVIGGQKIKPLALQTRKIEVQKTESVSEKRIQISVWDNEQIDGDKISLSLNGKWIIRNHELTKDKYVINIELLENQINQLVFVAENLGEIPPNTTALNINYKGYSKTHIMRSNMEKSGSINLYLDKN